MTILRDRRSSLGWVRVGMIGLTFAAGVFGAEYYVSPSGSPSGDGSAARPWDFQTALDQPSGVQPGDTIWLRGGTYAGGFTSRLNGTSSAPIIVRQYPGERATVDNATAQGNAGITVFGSYTWFWGFEVMNSSGSRWTSDSSAGGLNGPGFNIYAPGSKFINLVVHDADEGFGFWVGAVDGELNGNLVYNNGYMAPDRGHGHGIYVQNQTGTRRILDNIIFNQFSHGIHAYTESSYENGLWIEGNTSFNNGWLEGGYERNILVGPVNHPAQNPTLLSNYTYFLPSASAGENNIGYVAGCSNATVQNNYFAGGLALDIVNCSPITVSGNDFYDTRGSTPFFAGNTYYTAANPPRGTRVFIRPNQYEAGRANITIFNWAHAAMVQADLSSVLSPGTQYEIHDAENFFGPPLVSGTYSGGPITLPMTGLAVVQPIGLVPQAPVHTAPELGVFVVVPVSPGSPVQPPPPGQPPQISILTPMAGASVSGTISLTAAASSSAGIAGVQWILDGSNLEGPQTSPPYSFSWDTESVSNGSHTLTATATDNAGQSVTSAPVQVNVSNAATFPPGSGGGTVQPTIYWSFDSGSFDGSTATDLSGNNVNASAFNVASVPGAVHEAVSFDGADSYLGVYFGGTQLTELTSDMTLAAWINTTSSGDTQAVLSKYDAGGTESGYVVLLNPDGTLGLRVGGKNLAAGSARQIKDSTPVNDGRWHHFGIAIRLGLDVSFYIDGQLSSVKKLNTTAGSSGSPFQIGVTSYYGRPFGGALDEVQLYRQALTASQVQLLR